MAGNGGSNIRFTAVGTTDVGRIREHNEDNFLAVDLGAAKRGAPGEVLAGEVRAKGLSFVVADGMGGAAAGEVASQMAVDTLHDEFKIADLGGTVRAEPAVINVLEAAIHKANESIYRKGQDSKDHQGMGTTLTAAVVLGDSLYLSQVGDSRGYILRKGKLVQMTRDQSLIGQLIEEGTLTEEQAEKLGGKNIILQALGVEETLKIDSKRYDLLRGDILLLCSDGLSGMVPDARMEEILNAEPDMAAAGKKLIQAANEGGGKDNITCILAQFTGDGLREPLSPLTEAERAGGTFRAPEAPKSQAGRNAVLGTAALLVAVALFLFWPRGKTILVTVGPVAASVSAKGVGEAASKVDLPPVPSNPGEAVRLDVPAGIQVEITAVAPGYRPAARVVSTEVEHKEIPESMTMIRIPAKSLDFVPPEHRGKPLSRVEVLLVAGEEDQVAPEQAIIVQPDGAPELTEFPAGKWTAEAKRAGFKPASTPFAAASEMAEVVRLAAMVEEKGTLLVKDLPEGALVTVLDGEEELLDAPAAVLVTRTTNELSVRATRVTVRARKDGYEFLDQRADVKEGQPTEVTFADSMGKVSFQNQTGSISLRGPQPYSFSKDRKDAQLVAPGTYQLSYAPEGAARVHVPSFKVEPGQLRLNIDASMLGK